MSNLNNSVLNIEKIVFGKTDAFNELTELGPDYFLDSFVVNEKYRLQDFLSGEKYYICGKKGTGKTAFLRYLECKLKENPENLVIPIRFKSEFDETDKAQLMSMATSTKNEAEDTQEEAYRTSDILSQKSYVLMWKTFLINQIFLNMKKGEYTVFKEDENYELITNLLVALYGSTSPNSMIMPKLKKGLLK